MAPLVHRSSIAFVEDDPTTHARIARAIAADDSLRLDMAASTAQEIIDFLSSNSVDVLLVDLGLPDLPGLEVIRRSRAMWPCCAVMVLTMFGDETNMVQAFEAGATGYLLKDGAEADLAKHVRELRAGGSPIAPAIARQLLLRWQADSRKSAPAAAPIQKGSSGSLMEPLSTKELEVLDLTARGFTYQEVASRMQIAVSTVQSHVRNIYGKLDVHNKAEALYEARNLGLLR
ncbi:response regulator transcription factor [Variovorax sp. J22P271]|uniref:response regulator transcription factor n=1 Tax=Variovorax davisae TaxID=3053515 RepID=UPI0025753A4C|nr:response regulator transcription factor [Variovorax sp. J22P271]MDM0032066.1 response regulator transcription factor [Variovorax sp. J22P271]